MIKRWTAAAAPAVGDVRWRAGRGGDRGAVRRQPDAVRARQGGRCAGGGGREQTRAGRDDDGGVAWQTLVWILRRTPEMLAFARQDGRKGQRPQLRDKPQQPEYAKNKHRSIKPGVSGHVVGICTHLGCSPSEKFKIGAESGMGRGLAGRLPVPLPRLAVRPCRSRVQQHAGADNLEIPPHQYPRGHHHSCWRRREGLGDDYQIPSRSQLDRRALPAHLVHRKAHLSEYYAPKNFNFWYFFGSLALLVLVIQIVTGIFLVMHYKPDARQRLGVPVAFASVEYIMREVPGGWLIRYMHSDRASAFFIVVYLHMFRGLIYGSYRKPRELIWIFGTLIFLALMAEAFMGYLLPWGQMSSGAPR